MVNILDCKHILGRCLWKLSDKTAAALSFYLLCPFCPLFRGTGFCLYKLRLGESLVNLLIFAVYFAACFAGGFFTGRKVRNRRFFWGLLSGMFYFLILFAASWAMDPRASIQAARSLMVLGVCAFGGTLGNAQF